MENQHIIEDERHEKEKQQELDDRMKMKREKEEKKGIKRLKALKEEAERKAKEKKEAEEKIKQEEERKERIQNNVIANPNKGHDWRQKVVKFAPPANDKQAAVVGMLQHAWTGYTKYAWGHDHLRPITQTHHDWFGLGLTIVDGLDTLWILGLTDGKLKFFTFSHTCSLEEVS